MISADTTTHGLELLWVTVPLWAPALRACLPWRRLPWRRLPCAGRFTLTVAALVYGAFAACVALVMLPAEVLATFIGPQLLEMGAPGGRWVSALHADVVVPVFWAFIPALPGVTWVVMLVLARRWPVICDRLGLRAPAVPQPCQDSTGA